MIRKLATLVLVMCLGITPIFAQQKNQKKIVESGLKSSISLEQLIQKKSSDYVITKEHVSNLSGVHHIYLRQAINGLEVQGTESSVHIDKSGKAFLTHNNFLQDIQTTVKSSSQGISAKQAITSVARQMGYSLSNLTEIKSLGNKNQEAVFNKAGISSEEIPVKMMYYYREGKGTILVWELSISETTSPDWWNFRVDASSGQIIDKDNWTVSCNILGDHDDHKHVDSKEASPFVGPMNQVMKVKNSKKAISYSSILAPPAASYRVYAMPTESPNHGGRTLVSNPENLTASPFGWHDTNGVDGAEFTNSRGNNVSAYDDDNNNDQPDDKYAYSPGGNLIFDFPINTTYSNANQSEPAAITNLFYWTNIIHDVLYQYGFDEASGNFQENNYGKGGAGNDSVKAEAQDGSGTCNANFGTPADGSRPKMQMYVCTNRDGDLDNAVIIHEFGHGVSNRLTSLSGQEQMGEGWSDFYGLLLTMESGDAGPDSRGVGTWLTGEGPTGGGIRQFPYSTNMSVNPHTYNSIKSAVAPHGVGSVWTAMLWEMTWELIDVYGFDTDFYNGTGGNNIALALVTEGMKLQQSNPGFVDGRDGILAADQALYGGANECYIWEAFAKRGLGFSAIQGSSGSKTDGTEAFDLPPFFSGFDADDEICLAGGVVTGLAGGLPEGGAYSGSGVTDDGNGTTYTFDPSVAGVGNVTISYSVNDYCTGAPKVLTDVLEVTDNAPVIICRGTGLIPMEGSESNNTAVGIPDNNTTGVTSTMNVSEDVSITDLNVDFKITHTWVGDLTITLTSPDGTSAVVYDRPGVPASTFGCSGDNIDATMDDEAVSPVENQCGSGTPTISGSFTPNNPLSVFDGKSTMGDWKLKVVDAAAPDPGTLISWGITYSYEVTSTPLEVILDSSGNATINAEDLLYSFGVDCGTVTVLAGSPAAATVDFDCTTSGLVTVPVIVTNANGTSSTCDAQVNVTGGGSGPGTITCPDDINVDNTAGLCGAIVDYDIDTTGCSAVLNQTSGIASGGTFPIGVTTNAFQLVDGDGTVHNCSFTVTVSDTEAPVVACNSITVQLDTDGNATVTAAQLNNGSTDNCGIATSSIDITSFDCSNIGPNDVTLTVTDTNGNSNNCIAVVTVEDSVAPTITCPANQTIILDPGVPTYTLPDYFATGEATATDNCTNPVTITTQDPAAGSVLSEGVQTVTLTAEDGNGNPISCSFDLTVQITLGINDNTLTNSSIALYPNPTYNTVTLSNRNNIELVKVDIYDITGRLIKSVDLKTMGTEKSINVSSFASGQYLVMIQGRNSQITKQLIKK